MRVATFVIAGCFPASGCHQMFGLDTIDPLTDAGAADAADATDTPPVDAPLCFGTGLAKLCLMEPPPPALSISMPVNVDTDASPMCTPYFDGPADLCVIAYGTIAIQQGGVLRGIGTRRLVVLATGALTIANTGVIDVSSTPTVSGSAARGKCVATNPTNHHGGAGASLHGSGGLGGGAGGGIPQGRAMAASFLSGCSGGDGGDIAGATGGLGGIGGGAVYLIAGERLAIDGTVNASGAGGRGGNGDAMNGGAGAGGGGSGGFIGLDAPIMTISGGARIFANGGGGGEGAGQPSTGMAGATPSGPMIRAAGGAGASNGGDGGAGSAVLILDGSAGAGGGGLYGSGGGGGGAGFIVASPALPTGGTFSPAPLVAE